MSPSKTHVSYDSLKQTFDSSRWHVRFLAERRNGFFQAPVAKEVMRIRQHWSAAEFREFHEANEF
jgi:hypothetical protein